MTVVFGFSNAAISTLYFLYISTLHFCIFAFLCFSISVFLNFSISLFSHFEFLDFCIFPSEFPSHITLDLQRPLNVQLDTIDLIVSQIGSEC